MKIQTAWLTGLRPEQRRRAWRDRLVNGLAPLASGRAAPAQTRGPLSVCLGRSEVMRLTKICGRREIRIQRGTVWITGTPAGADVVLQAGTWFSFGDQWPFVLQALEDAEFLLA